MKEKIVNDNLLKTESFFWAPEYLEISAWTEHIPFAFWITETVKPKIFVELGVHVGTSYFSFCQAIKKINLNAACYGVDTWKGDEHAGFYGEDIYAKVSNYNSSEYSGFSTLIRSTFDEAKEYFVDKSIDLLHIDGLHTYEAVKHDFETWLPKLSQRAIVIFHDINVRERNFGVFKYWSELKREYRHFEFDFGHGLGVLTIGNGVKKDIDILFNRNKRSPYYTFLKNLFSERGNFFKTTLGSYLSLKYERDNFEMINSAHAQLSERCKELELKNTELQETIRILLQ